jgi:hypothetical protein
MEVRPSSGTDDPIRREDLNRALLIHRTLIRWEEPRHAFFANFSARLLYFDKTDRETENKHTRL